MNSWEEVDSNIRRLEVEGGWIYEIKVVEQQISTNQQYLMGLTNTVNHVFVPFVKVGNL